MPRAEESRKRSGQASVCRITFATDGMFEGPVAVAELAASELLLENPTVNLDWHVYSDVGMTYGDLCALAPRHLIGRAPHILVLMLGYNDVFSKAPMNGVLGSARELMQLILDKTRAQVFISNLCTLVFQARGVDAHRCRIFNAGLAQQVVQCDKRVHLVDMEGYLLNWQGERRRLGGAALSLVNAVPRWTTIGSLVCTRALVPQIAEAIGDFGVQVIAGN